MYSQMAKQGKPVILFLSYAYEDEELLQELETRLSLLGRQEPTIAWNKQHIGDEWVQVNDELLEQASIVLLLVSPDFMATSDCYEIATRSRQRQENDQVSVIPIWLRPSDLRYAPFEMRTLLPSNGKPITEWADRNAAFDNVVQGVRSTIIDLSRKA